MIVIEKPKDFFRLLTKMSESEDYRERSCTVFYQPGHTTFKHPQYGWVHCYEVTEDSLKENGVEYVEGYTKGER